MSLLLLRLLPWILGAAGIAGASAWTTHSLDNARYEALQATFAKYQAQVQASELTAQHTADEALQAQLRDHQEAEQNNAQVRQNLEAERDTAVRDRQFAERLLQRAQSARGTGHSSAVPATSDRSGAPESSSGGSDQSIADQFGNAAFECRTAILTLIALQDEIRPQLRSR